MPTDVTFSGSRNIAMKVPSYLYEATVQFYRDVVGLKLLERHAPLVVFEFGGNQLWIDDVPALSQAEVWLELTTTDLAAAADHLQANQVVRRDEIELLPEGFQGFWISNPCSIIHMVALEDETT
jgi:catechol 2,3-dioxygenase-like lactoylglutathione lyase family enzyme